MMWLLSGNRLENGSPRFSMILRRFWDARHPIRGHLGSCLPKQQFGEGLVFPRLEAVRPKQANQHVYSANHESKKPIICSVPDTVIALAIKKLHGKVQFTPDHPASILQSHSTLPLIFRWSSSSLLSRGIASVKSACFANGKFLYYAILHWSFFDNCMY